MSFETWLNSLKPFARLHEVGEIADLFEAAAMGHLEDTGDASTPIKPIRSDPELFELRRRALSKQLRFYHGEPEAYPDALIALHKHLKDAATQQQEIDFAVNRYRQV